MLEREILIGVEEAGGIGIQRHLPERDGLLNALLLANIMAERKKTLGQLVAELQAEYGEHQIAVMLGGPERAEFYEKAQPWLLERTVDEIVELSQALRIPGMTPAAIALVAAHVSGQLTR